MDNRKLIHILALVLLVSPIYSEQPIVGYPITINNVVNLTDTNSYATYLINLYNPTNHTFSYFLYPLSSQWQFIFGEKNTQISGYLNPNQLYNITVYLRPYGISNQIPLLVVYLKDMNETNVYYSYTITFTPTLLYNAPTQVISVETNQTNVTKNETNRTIVIYPITGFFELSSYNVYPGNYLYIYINVNNPNDFNLYQTLYISTNYSYYQEINETIYPGLNLYLVPLYVPDYINPGTYSLDIKLGNISKTFVFEVLVLNTTPIITVFTKGMDIIVNITNPYNYVINYTYYLPEKYWIFSIFNPQPNYFTEINGTKYGVYYIILLPGQSFIISESFDTLLLITIVGLAILIMLTLLYMLKDNVEIIKEVSKVDLKNGYIDVVITIKNKSLFPLNDVKISDRVNSPLKIKEYKTIEPSSVYRSPNGYVINWKVDNIKRNEEYIISYRIELKTEEEVKSIEIPRASISYRYLFKESTKYSNSLVIKVTK
ncbi:MAG: hypothetical protein ACP5G1_01810 [Nanopusillaceae archaeon]